MEAMKATYKRKRRSKAHSMAMHEVIRNQGELEHITRDSVNKKLGTKAFLPFFFERDGIGKLIPNMNVIPTFPDTKQNI